MVNESFLNVTTRSLSAVNNIATTIVVGIVIFLLGLIIGRVAGKLLERMLKDFSVDSAVKKTTGVNVPVEKTISQGVSIVIYLTFLVIALNYIGITSLLLNVLSVAVILVLSISLLLAVKDSVPNIIAYRLIKRKGSIKIGDVLVVDNFEGKVVDIGLFETQVKTEQKDIIHIPNVLFTKQTFIKKAKHTEELEKVDV